MNPNCYTVRPLFGTLYTWRSRPLVTGGLGWPQWGLSYISCQRIYHSFYTTTPCLWRLAANVIGSLNNKWYIYIFTRMWEIQVIVQTLQNATDTFLKSLLLLSLIVARSLCWNCSTLAQMTIILVTLPLCHLFRIHQDFWVPTPLRLHSLSVLNIWWQCRRPPPTAGHTTALSFLFVVKNKTVGPKWSCLC